MYPKGHMANRTYVEPTLEQVAALCKRRGYVYPTSTIYGGLANSYDYGPLGVELMRTIKNLWWRTCITNRDDMVGLDSQIILHPQTWVASGHVGSFSDPLVEDTVSHNRFRADHVIEAWLEKNSDKLQEEVIVENLSLEQMGAFIVEHAIKSPDGNPLTSPKAFNLLFETAIGAVSGEKAKVYLRGETAQGIFSDFKNILQSTRVQLPFGVGQIGKSFRNEVTTGQFVFRTFEFEQAEIEYFFNPAHSDWRQLMDDWKTTMWSFVTETLGVDADHLRWRQHTDRERSHYSLDTYDLEYKFAFGWKEIWGLAYRTDYDLKQHQQFSGESLEYTDPNTGEKFLPHVIEPAVGINRLFLMVLAESYWEDAEKQRTVLSLKTNLAPYRAAVFPLVKNKPELVEKANAVFHSLKANLAVTWDDRGNIGKRYLYQDEIGTPFCITIDYQTLEDNTVTIRDRDSAAQRRVAIDTLVSELS